MFLELDVDADGAIDFEEFMAAMISSWGRLIFLEKELWKWKDLFFSFFTWFLFLLFYKLIIKFLKLVFI